MQEHYILNVLRSNQWTHLWWRLRSGHSCRQRYSRILHNLFLLHGHAGTRRRHIHWPTQLHARGLRGVGCHVTLRMQGQRGRGGGAWFRRVRVHCCFCAAVNCNVAVCHNDHPTVTQPKHSTRKITFEPRVAGRTIMQPAAVYYWKSLLRTLHTWESHSLHMLAAYALHAAAPTTMAPFYSPAAAPSTLWGLNVSKPVVPGMRCRGAAARVRVWTIKCPEPKRRDCENKLVLHSHTMIGSSRVLGKKEPANPL